MANDTPHSSKSIGRRFVTKVDHLQQFTVSTTLMFAPFLITFVIFAHEIDRMPEQSRYDELTKRIRDSSIRTGVEPYLRERLKQEGINTD